MEDRRRTVVGVIWLFVAVLAFAAADPGESLLRTAVGLFAVALALWLAVLYLFDPWDILERYHP
ncbi:hypothetical protein [Salinarchaeum sp. Harcht-Bsk1]|uniref:hypothetical protein n=1 Tax=Salinarchaeum sp. Harcht-Bsk1 TaxID=1333523 RepID=UPI0006776843|nr:hypothetical protein [Salinarchaeum sp. Harcht-Bsk1]